MLHHRTVLAAAAPLFRPSIGRAQNRSVIKFIRQADPALLDPV